MLSAFFFYCVSKGTSYSNQRKYGQLSFVCIFLFAFFRYNIGSDYPSYWNIMTDPSYNREEFEFISGAVIKLAYNIHFPPLAFVFFASLSLFCYKRVIVKYSSFQSLSWYFYFSFPLLFLNDCSTIRQAGAMGMFFMTFYFVDAKKMIGAVICVVLAIGFHRSGLMAVILLFLPLIKNFGLKTNITIFACSFLTGKGAEIIISHYFSNFEVAYRFLQYADKELDGFKIFQYVLFLINFFNLLFYERLTKIRQQNQLYISLVNIGLCFFNIFAFEPVTAQRLCTFFLLFEILLVTDYRYILSKYTKSIRFSTLLLFSSMFLLQIMLVFSYIRAGMQVLTPYDIWLFHI